MAGDSKVIGAVPGLTSSVLSGLMPKGRSEAMLQSLKELSSDDGISMHKTSADQNPEQVKKAATQFEGLLLQQMFSSMWSTVHTKDALLGSKDEETYRDMFNQALADSIAQGQGIGIKDVIAKEISKKQS